VSLYHTLGGEGQHWSARALASFLAAQGICGFGLVAYVRLVRKRPRRSEILFLAIASARAAVGWYAIQNAFSFLLVATVTVAFVVLRQWLKRQLFDPWLLEAGDPNFVVFPTDDAGLEAAKAQARATLPEFLRRLSAPGADLSSAAVKAPLPVPGGTEHVWLSAIRCEGDEFVGTVENHPSAETGVRIGAIVRVAQAEISDWKLVERGQLVGGFTIRYFMSLMQPAQRAAVQAGLPFAIGHEAIPPAA
jgi:uncharacterized protein YegJ (DUF2314 family)